MSQSHTDINEAWKDVPGYEGLYQVSDHGHVRSSPNTGIRGKRKAGRTLRQASNQYGHKWVMLYKDQSGVKHYIHRLVLLAFVGPCSDGMQGRHLDGNASNNNLVNLKWGSPAENAADKLTHGTQPMGRHTYNAKLTEEDVCKIRSMNGLYQDIGVAFGVSASLVGAIKRREKWRHI